jgi:hypothetical protein
MRFINPIGTVILSKVDEEVLKHYPIELSISASDQHQRLSDT